MNRLKKHLKQKAREEKQREHNARILAAREAKEVKERTTNEDADPTYLHRLRAQLPAK